MVKNEEFKTDENDQFLQIVHYFTKNYLKYHFYYKIFISEGKIKKNKKFKTHVNYKFIYKILNSSLFYKEILKNIIFT